MLLEIRLVPKPMEKYGTTGIPRKCICVSTEHPYTKAIVYKLMIDMQHRSFAVPQ
jgi:hypothetical protein